VLRAAIEEVAAHLARIEAIDKASRGACVWKRLAAPVSDPVPEPAL
jgi:hypothetical protein